MHIPDDACTPGQLYYDLIMAGMCMTEQSSATSTIEAGVGAAVAGGAAKLFPTVNLSGVTREGSTLTLQRVQRDPGIKQLCTIFSSVGLAPRLGYNMGSLDITLTLTIPVLGVTALPTSSAAAIVWMMLGLFFEHASWLESKWRSSLPPPSTPTRRSEAAAAPTPTSGKGKGRRPDGREHLLANQCLMFFLEQTGVAVVTKRANFRLGHMTIGIEAASRGVIRVKDGQRFTDRDNTPFKYSPSYKYLSGFCPELGHCSEPAFEVQQQLLVNQMLDEFWTIVGNYRYFPDEILKDEVTRMLAQYFSAGLQGEAEGFSHGSSHQPLSIYLHGRAGIGKSQFVKVFTSSLRVLLRRYVDPEKRVDVVRVPLNSITPSNFRKILLVQGISDFSIERILEQTVCKGGIVILHLEENPEDVDMQIRLFELTHQLLDSIVSRYPEHRGNIIYVFTSNYPAAPHIEGITRALVHVQPPCPSTQREWCLRALQHSMSSFLEQQASSIETRLELNIQPPFGQDMRRLETYHMSISFLAASHILRYKVASKLPISVALDPYTTPDDDPDHEDTTAEWMAISFSDPDIPTLPICTHDRFFYFNPEMQRQPAIKTLMGIEHTFRPTVATLVDMVQNNFLKPAVLVLVGESEARVSYDRTLRAYLQAAISNGSVQTTSIRAETEDDKAVIFGDPQSPSLGGLYRFIDSVTNPVYGLDDHYAYVSAEVNELGQFMLRELLESDTSRTHRNRILKDRTVFVLSLLDGTELSPQLQSRAHAIIQC